MTNELFSACSTQSQQNEWLRSHMLPCPFCGGEVVVFQPTRGREAGGEYWELGCKAVFGCVSPRVADKDPKRALELWNTRKRLP